MGDSPKDLICRFFDAWVNPNVEELGSFFAQDAVWVDGPQGVRHGAHSIAAQLTAVGGRRWTSCHS